MTSVFLRIDHSRTADEVVSQMETLILEGVLNAGDRLPAERELALKLDVSRPILRDALKALEARGLLRTGRDGTRVADVTGQVFSPPIAALIAGNAKAARDYLDYRREIEAIAAEFAALRATDEDRAMLTVLMARMEHAHRLDDFDDDVAIDVEFHTAIGECAHNIILMHTLRACYRLLAEGVFSNRERVYALPGARQALFDQHRAIHDAVMMADRVAARAAATAHIDYVIAAADSAAQGEERARVARMRMAQRGLVEKSGDAPHRQGKETT